MSVTSGAIITVAVLALSGCAGSVEGVTTSAGAVSAELSGVGPITLVQGKAMAPTTSSFVHSVLADWNAQHPDQTATLVELSESPDAQRQQLVQNALAKSDAYDVVVIDNVWTTEFAANHYLTELPSQQFPTGDLLPPVLQASMYQNKLYAVPTIADGGMLYYRTDLLREAGIAGPPSTWAELIADCDKVKATTQGAGVDCYAGQFDKYEGLTVNFTEAVDSAGGEITTGTGMPDVDTPQARAGLDFLVNGFKNGYIPKDAIGFDEEKSRTAFQDGHLVFQRQWPYQYEAVAATDGSSAVAGKFAVAPLPGLNGTGVSALGGHAAGISRFSTKKKSALDFIAFYTSLENSRKNLELDSKAPVYASLYDDPGLRGRFPFLPVLKQSILTAKPRPKVVRYGDATAAIQDAVYGALQQRTTSAQALTQLQAALDALGN